MSNKVISWDIGIKNLSYCILEESDSKDDNLTKHNLKVLDWEVIDLFPAEEYFCSTMKKNNLVCNKKASFKNNDEYYCKVHSKKVDCKKIKYKKNKYTPTDYAIQIKKELDSRKNILDCNIILLENQPALKNPIMKTIQIILLSYFSFKYSENNILTIKNVNAKRKEKLPDNDDNWINSSYQKLYLNRIKNINNNYSKRKFLCYYYALSCLKNYPEMESYLSNHKKKDDLTDSFLMCVDWFLNSNK